MRVKTLVLAAASGAVSVTSAHAGISYTSNGSLYTQNFNSLPTDMPNNANIETVYTDGWQDDVDAATSTQSDVSIIGWHLRHPIAIVPTSSEESGFNGNQRLRAGPGANTGAFWAFSSTNSANAEKALGNIGSNTTAANGENLRMGLQLVNNTGETLTSFTITFDGEEWRDGQGATAETMTFDYSLVATDADWFANGTSFTAVPALNFTAPVFAGTGASGTAVDGDVAGRVNNITATVTGIGWHSGTELWLRWSDPNAAGVADDGLAIDDFEFTAVPEPAGLAFLGLGTLCLIRRRRD